MKHTARISIATAFALATCLFASASLATNTRDAIRACDANPKCNFDVGKDGVVISVGGSLIVCPIKNGPCGVARTNNAPTEFPDATEDQQFESLN